MHLTQKQIAEMLSMGHSVGVHTRTHISVAASKLNTQDFLYEIVEPKKFLEDTFSTQVVAFSYPFGEKQDCLQSAELIERTDIYKVAFTVEERLNNSSTSLFEVGRYSPRSQMSAADLKNRMDEIIKHI